MSWWQKFHAPDTECLDVSLLRGSTGVPPKPAIPSLQEIVDKLIADVEELIREKSELELRVAQLEQQNRDLQSQLQRMIQAEISR